VFHKNVTLQEALVLCFRTIGSYDPVHRAINTGHFGEVLTLRSCAKLARERDGLWVVHGYDYDGWDVFYALKPLEPKDYEDYDNEQEWLECSMAKHTWRYMYRREVKHGAQKPRYKNVSHTSYKRYNLSDVTTTGWDLE
jgi:hypothetical protein